MFCNPDVQGTTWFFLCSWHVIKVGCEGSKNYGSFQNWWNTDAA